MIKPAALMNMTSPVFSRRNKLQLLMYQLRAVLHVSLHYFRSQPLYATFLSDLTTSDRNMNLSLRSTPEQYSRTLDALKGSTGLVVRDKEEEEVMVGSVSYRRNSHYKKNMHCSGQGALHVGVVNDEFVSRSTGAENNPENDHIREKNKQEMELNDKEHVMTLVCTCLYLFSEFCQTQTIPTRLSHNGHESDGTVMTTRSDGFSRNSKARLNLNLKPRSKKRKRKRRRVGRADRTETDSSYVLSRIYAEMDVASYLDPVCCSALRRLYSGEWGRVRQALCVCPLSAVCVVLGRLEQKSAEWRAEREAAKGVFVEVAQRNHVKALDWQPKLKRIDKTRLSADEVWRELLAAQSLLDPEFTATLAKARHKRSALKEQQPMHAASTIRPTKSKAEVRTPPDADRPYPVPSPDTLRLSEAIESIWIRMLAARHPCWPASPEQAMLMWLTCDAESECSSKSVCAHAFFPEQMMLHCAASPMGHIILIHEL